MIDFNQTLIARTIKYFEEKHGLEISPEKAEEYLTSMAEFYASAIDFCDAYYEDR